MTANDVTTMHLQADGLVFANIAKKRQTASQRIREARDKKLRAALKDHLAIQGEA